MTSAIVSPSHSAALAVIEFVVLDDLRQDRDPGRPEEHRDRRHQEAQRVDEQDVGHGSQWDEQDHGRAEDVADDQHLALVPAIHERARERRQEQVRERRRQEDERGRERGPRHGEDHHADGQLVDPVAEQRDQLAGPQRRERPVEGQPDVGVLADAVARRRCPDGAGRRRPRRTRPSARVTAMTAPVSTRPA